MSEVDTQRLGLGALLLLAGAAIVVYVTSQGTAVLPGVAGSVAVLGMAAGALLLGTSERGRPV